MTTSFTAPILRALRLENIIDMKNEMVEFLVDEMARVQPHSEGNYMERFEAEASKAMPGSRLERRVINSDVNNNVCAYTVFHPLVVDVACVLSWAQSMSMVQKQNTRNIYHKRMKDGVDNISEC